jgi:hypothetical protein
MRPFCLNWMLNTASDAKAQDLPVEKNIDWIKRGASLLGGFID